MLLVGPPGTGKTLLARAIAGEADVPFFSISGSDFVEMFVGVGASRVRDMFEQGKKSAPCIIFIDEIDAVGRHRGHGVGGGHDEREQTLNALLVEMDGFDTQEGVIIIAATNRPDVLDPALLRPGRFDRQITVNLPDVKGREEILRVHSKKVKLAEGVDLAVVARGTPGYSGAELANVINEAALLAARRGLKGITLHELEEARDKVRWGKERRSLALSEKEKTNTAYHEAGHALLLELLPHTEPLHKVTIIPRGPSLGITMWLPEEDKYTNRKNELLDSLAVKMGGRVAEEIVFGDVTNGATGDIRMATAMARKMVCEWGMSEKMGMVEYGEHEDYVFLGRDISRARDYSEATAEEIDREVRRLLDDAYAKAKEVLIAHREHLEVIAKALLEYETLDGLQIKEIIKHGRLINPPPGPPASTGPKMPPEKPPKQVVQAPDVAPGLPGALGRRSRLTTSASRISVRLHFTPLNFHEVAQLSLHRLERIVHDLAQRIVCAVVELLFITHQFVPRWNRHINSHAIRISLLMRMVRLLDGDIASADVIAKAIQPRSFRENQLLNFFRFLQTAVGDVYRQSHDSMDIVRPLDVEEKKKQCRT